MLFNSIQYLLFFPIVLILLRFSPSKIRAYIVLLLSIYFYTCWKLEYILLIIVSIVFNYLIGLKIYQVSGKQKKAWLWLCIIVNFGVLFLFKYFNFSVQLISDISSQFFLHFDKPSLELLLPVGISFYTFESISYIVDIYRGTIEPEKKILNFSLYITFFPKLVAGPIERAKNLIPQFYRKFQIKKENLVLGAQIVIFGLFKKVVVADRLAPYVNQVYENPIANSGFPVLFGILFFSFQIYYDFSGYSDIAIGSAKILGINLSENFNRPYGAKSFSEFWRKWHITLSTWFKDYLYIPLGGNRMGAHRVAFNLILTFVLSGLWHGANLTFIIWGFIHGLLLVGENLVQKIFSKVSFFSSSIIFFKSITLKLFVFSTISIVWVFFRANDFNTAISIIVNAFSFKQVNTVFILGQLGFVLSVFFVLFVQIAEYIKHHDSWRQKNLPIFKSLYYYFLICCILFLGIDNSEEFIYFQF